MTMKQDNKNLEEARNALFKTLNDAKRLFGKDFSDVIDKFYASEKENPMPTEDQVTRGYCLNYQKGFGEKILNNLQQYQRQSLSSEKATTKENSLYLNSKYQLQNMTVKVDQKIVPTVLVFEGKEYPIQCSYKEAQKYDEALAVNSPIKDVVYPASDYFYNKISPQIDYIIVCTSEKPLPEKNKMTVGDTYPWYQPIVVGSNGMPAAGNSLVDVKDKQITLVLGHEPCVCNENNEQKCDKIKKVSREYKTRVWKLVTSLEAEKSQHNAQGQEAINSFTSYVKSEIKKDFCFIDRDAIMKKLADTVETMKKVEPKGIKH